MNVIFHKINWTRTKAVSVNRNAIEDSIKMLKPCFDNPRNGVFMNENRS